MEREITTHHKNLLNDAIKVTAIGEPGPGGACMRYRVCVPMKNPVERYPEENSRLMRTYTDITFQNGNPSDQINGISNEALLAVVLDRLEGFDKGPFTSHENAMALSHVELAMQYLQARTKERETRGVEGTLQP